MQGTHPSNPLTNSQRANVADGDFMKSNFQFYSYKSGNLPNYIAAESDVTAQQGVANQTQGAAKEFIGCK